VASVEYPLVQAARALYRIQVDLPEFSCGTIPSTIGQFPLALASEPRTTYERAGITPISVAPRAPATGVVI